jgi:hypothetical protein
MYGGVIRTNVQPDRLYPLLYQRIRDRAGNPGAESPAAVLGQAKDVSRIIRNIILVV